MALQLLQTTVHVVPDLANREGKGKRQGPSDGSAPLTVAFALTSASLNPMARAKKSDTRLGSLPVFLRAGRNGDGAGCFVEDDGLDVAGPVTGVAVGEAAGEGGRGGAVGVVDVLGALLGYGEGRCVGSVAELGPLGVQHSDIDGHGREPQQGHHENRDQDADGAALAVVG